MVSHIETFSPSYPKDLQKSFFHSILSTNILIQGLCLSHMLANEILDFLKTKTKTAMFGAILHGLDRCKTHGNALFSAGI